MTFLRKQLEKWAGEKNEVEPVVTTSLKYGNQ